VLGYFFHMREADLNYQIDPREVDEQVNRINASKYPFIIYQEQNVGVVLFIKTYAPESNLDMFTESAASSGYFTTTSDPDGVVRWMPLMIQDGEDLYPPLAVSAAWQALPRHALTDGEGGALWGGRDTDGRPVHTHRRKWPTAH
jgi:CHASE2 domain